VTTIARSHPLKVRARSSFARALAGFLSLATLLLLLLLLLLLASPAGAFVTTVEGTTVGLQPRNGEGIGPSGEKAKEKEQEVKTFSNESGNAVMHGSSEFVIYWDPEARYHHEWVAGIDGFMQQIEEGGLSVPFSVVAEYRDRTNAISPFHSVFKGSYSDTVNYPKGGCADPNAPEKPTICLTDAQLREQLQSFIAAHNLPKGMGAVYYLLTPPGVTVCLDSAGTHCSDYSVSLPEAEKEERKSVSYKHSFCSYHGAINPDKAPEGDGNTIIYATIPWALGTLGLAESKPSGTVYEAGFDCQDGGFNPAKHEEREKAKEMSEEEIKAFEKDTAEVQAEIRKKRRLEGPHQEEPNQGKSEDFGNSLGLYDLIANQMAVEEMNTVTDPLLNGWQSTVGGDEVTDICRNFFASTAGPEGGSIDGGVEANLETEAGTLSNISLGSNRYYVQNVFNASNDGCSGGVALAPRFTAPNPVNASEIVGVDGMESNLGLMSAEAFGPSGPPSLTYATFSWNFGDGTPVVKGFAPGAPICEAPWLSPCAASAFHSYQYGGKYKITLTVTDIAGNSDSVTHEVTVDGPPPPGSGEPAGPGSSGSSGSSSSSAAGSAAAGGGSGAGAGAGPGNPAAAAAVVSRTLRSATKSGVVVSYSVNEQVAGHFEVLLSRAVARRLHITGPAAVGLPAGSPPSLVVAKALIVTTAGGRSSVKLLFSKKNAQRLSHQRKVTFLLRMVVHNAATSHPVSSTVLSSFTLTH
jgi:hypothetical protein